jgi:hypothetical protein
MVSSRLRDGPPAIFAKWDAEPGENVNSAREAGLKKVRADMHDLLFAWYDPAKNPYRPQGSQ